MIEEVDMGKKKRLEFYATRLQELILEFKQNTQLLKKIIYYIGQVKKTYEVVGSCSWHCKSCPVYSRVCLHSPADRNSRYLRVHSVK